MKIAVSGKGGVGKTTICALLARVFAFKGYRVIAVDADPVACLGASLGISEKSLPTPIAEMKQLITERTGAKPGSYGALFKMNPRVDDIPEKYSAKIDNIKLLVMGSVEKGGSGCVCPESVLLKNLIQHLILFKDEIVIMDMEAGVEHLGRATSRAVGVLLIVVNSGKRTHFAARKIKKLANDIGIKNIKLIGNMVRSNEEKQQMIKSLSDFEFIEFIPDVEEIRWADARAVKPFNDIKTIPDEIWKIADVLINQSV